MLLLNKKKMLLTPVSSPAASFGAAAGICKSISLTDSRKSNATRYGNDGMFFSSTDDDDDHVNDDDDGRYYENGMSDDTSFNSEDDYENNKTTHHNLPKLNYHNSVCKKTSNDNEDKKKNYTLKNITNKLMDFQKHLVPQRLTHYSHQQKKFDLIMDEDLDARERCFNYILETIDEVWARYCDTTTLVEEKIYNGNKKTNNRSLSINCISSSSSSSSSQDYGNGTVDLKFDITKLSHFKKRLSSTKTNIENLVDSTEMVDIVMFWKHWDLIKYNCIQFMENSEDDEEDEEVDIVDRLDGNSKKLDSFEMCDEVLNRLENGRYYYNNNDI